MHRNENWCAKGLRHRKKSYTLRDFDLWKLLWHSRVVKWTLAIITEDGVWFLSPHGGTPVLLMSEASISLQNSIGSSDITPCKSGELCEQ